MKPQISNLKSQNRSGLTQHLLHAKGAGFTLIELLVYVSIFSIVSLLVVNLILTFIDIQGQVASRSEVQHNIRFSIDQISRAIHNSTGVVSASSSTLTLAMPDLNKNPTIFNLSNGVLRITEGASAPSPLTSDLVNVDTLSFQQIDNPPPAKATIQMGIFVSYKSYGQTGLEYLEGVTTTMAFK